MFLRQRKSVRITILKFTRSLRPAVFKHIKTHSQLCERVFVFLYFLVVAGYYQYRNGRSAREVFRKATHKYIVDSAASV